MPKLKTNKSAKKRVKKTSPKNKAETKIMISHSTRNHRMTHKSKSACRANRKSKQIVLGKGSMVKAFAKLLPNS